jgi:hypothetical protein
MAKGSHLILIYTDIFKRDGIFSGEESSSKFLTRQSRPTLEQAQQSA